MHQAFLEELTAQQRAFCLLAGPYEERLRAATDAIGGLAWAPNIWTYSHTPVVSNPSGSAWRRRATASSRRERGSSSRSMEPSFPLTKTPRRPKLVGSAPAW